MAAAKINTYWDEDIYGNSILVVEKGRGRIRRKVMSDIMLYLIKAVIVVSITIVMRYFVPWIREKIEASQYAWIAKWAETAVNAIQQTDWDKSGPERKAKVVELLRALLIKKNIAISDAELNAIIEAAVWAMKQDKKEERSYGKIMDC